VSGAGLDTNPCSLSSPCRTFTQAISQTNPAGEVTVLDSAGYGSFTISKALSIIAAPGVYAGISVFSDDGIDISAGAADTIILRGLTVNNQGSAGNGVNCITAGLVHAENCVINGFSMGNGFETSSSAKVSEIKDSTVRDCQTGIMITGPVAATVEHVRVEANGDGLISSYGATVTVRNSLFSLNQAGFSVFTNSLNVELNVERCVISNSSTGIEAVGGSTGIVTVRLSNSTVTGNGTGLFNNASSTSLLSRGNNTIEGNATDTNGAIGSYTAN
jgi:nitrous oxidase accessory protein NosD